MLKLVKDEELRSLLEDVMKTLPEIGLDWETATAVDRAERVARWNALSGPELQETKASARRLIEKFGLANLIQPNIDIRHGILQ